MKLNILSDLHLSRSILATPDNDADVVILAGDIARPEQAVKWASRLDKPVLYVPGNHEFYDGSIVSTATRLKLLCAGTHIHVLDDDVFHLNGVRFLGSTLWTDFLLYGDGDERASAVEEAFRSMRDFQKIHLDEAGTLPFTPLDSEALFRRHAAWLAARLAEPHNGPTVVITHHAPSPRSIHPRFADSLLNPCFVSNAEHLVDGNRVQLWVHGHTHDSFDYNLNGTRVVCNPRGYASGVINENAQFNANFMVSLIQQ